MTDVVDVSTQLLKQQSVYAGDYENAFHAYLKMIHRVPPTDTSRQRIVASQELVLAAQRWRKVSTYTRRCVSCAVLVLGTPLLLAARSDV